MITPNQNKALLVVGNEAKQHPKWVEYAKYCFAREQGIRKIAFQHLNTFIESAQHWTFDEKKIFLEFLFLKCETLPEADYGPFPQPLSEKLVESCLKRWCEIETEDSRPFRWYGKYYRCKKYLKRALEMNPHDDLARIVLLHWITSDIFNSTHHLPDYYIGDPKRDLERAERAQNYIDKLVMVKWYVINCIQ